MFVYAIWNIVGLVQYATICRKMSPEKLLCTFVRSRLDYCNSLLVGCPKYLLCKLQKVQNNAARLIFRTTRSAHFSQILYSLPWLPIKQRIEYKLSWLCFQITSLIWPPSTFQNVFTFTLLPGSSALLQTPDTIPSFPTKSSGQLSFSYHCTSVSSFHSSLKTFLFSKTFSSFPLP